jgi:hypothetical protein
VLKCFPSSTTGWLLLDSLTTTVILFCILYIERLIRIPPVSPSDSWKQTWVRADLGSHLQRRNGPLVCPCTVVLDHCNHEHTVYWSGSHTVTSQPLRYLSPVLLSTSRWYQAPLELCQVHSNCGRAFLGTSESTCSNGCAFRILRDSKIRILNFSCSCNHCENLRETSRAADSTAQLCGKLVAILSQLCFLEYHNHKAFCLRYLSLLQSQDSLHHNIAWIILVSLSI